MQRHRASKDAGRWFVLAVGSLAVAGAFSLVLVLGRLPFETTAALFDAALAQRSLVVHVNLAMGVWFFACIAGLFCLMPGRGLLSRAAVQIALAGVILMIIPTFFPTVTPILSNYVPVLDHPLYLAALAIFAGGVVLNFVDGRMFRPAQADDAVPIDAQYGLRAAAIVFAVALITIAVSGLSQPAGTTGWSYYERLFWGGGHVLQSANALGMLAAWLILLRYLTGRRTVESRAATALFSLMVAPTLPGPWLALGRWQGPGYTRMMQYGIFPVVLVVAACGARALWARRHHDHGEAGGLRSLALVGLLSSIVMTLAGFVLGAMIVADTTLTPAHYHANIGAVTIAYMTVLMVLLPRLGAAVSWPRLARWQPLIYGTGQMLFVLGLAVAGTLGQAPRKTYGQVQPMMPSAERIGLIIVAIGGVLALGGGALFIAIMARAALAARRSRIATSPPLSPPPSQHR